MPDRFDPPEGLDEEFPLAWWQRVSMRSWGIFAGVLAVVALGVLVVSNYDGGSSPSNKKRVKSFQIKAGEKPPKSDPAGSAAKAELTYGSLEAPPGGGTRCHIKRADADFTVSAGWKKNSSCTVFSSRSNPRAAGPVRITMFPTSKGDFGQADQKPLDGTFVQQAKVTLTSGLVGTRTEIIPASGYEDGVHIVRWRIPVGETTLTITAPANRQKPAGAIMADQVAATLARST